MNLKKTFLFTFIIASISTQLFSKNNKYTMNEIYNQMCIQCHSSDGSGNPDKLTPSMRDRSLSEIQLALWDIEQEKDHIIMSHNREKILEKGMQYNIIEMSKYLYKKMHP
jgi:cytochrome c553